MWGNCWAHVIGTTVATGYFALVLTFGPRVMLDQSWRSEMLIYETKRAIEGNTTERVADAGTNFDHISSVAELDDWDVNAVVQEYVEEALPDADVLTVAGKTFEPRWNESNARGALMENVVLADNDLIIFPSNLSLYFCTIVFLFGVVVSGMVVASMVYIYQRVLMGLLGYLTCLKQDGLSKESAKFYQLNLAREVVRLGIALAFALFCLAQVTVFGWLESAKAWSFGDSLYWGAFTFTTIGHSPVLPTYMMGRPQMTTWLSLCHFCMHLQTNASIALFMLSALRCWDARNSLQTVRLSDLEIRSVMAVDHERIIAQDNSRPRFHN
uniref:Potassium channel domain-containing protein n=1 Tax=Pristionchus pacificus TaxID=54126 RepID=A0A8R1YS45_PRIPA